MLDLKGQHPFDAGTRSAECLKACSESNQDDRFRSFAVLNVAWSGVVRVLLTVPSQHGHEVSALKGDSLMQ